MGTKSSRLKRFDRRFWFFTLAMPVVLVVIALDKYASLPFKGCLGSLFDQYHMYFVLAFAILTAVLFLAAIKGVIIAKRDGVTGGIRLSVLHSIHMLLPTTSLAVLMVSAYFVAGSEGHDYWAGFYLEAGMAVFFLMLGLVGLIFYYPFSRVEE